MKHRSAKTRAHQPTTTYTLMHKLMASPTAPMPQARRNQQLLQMWNGLASIEKGETPSHNDWRVCSDAVNLLETLVTSGALADTNGLLPDAVAALANAAMRHTQTGAAIRLNGPGIQTVRAVLEDYAAALEMLPERTIIEAHRATEQRIRAIHQGRGQAHDVEVVALRSKTST